MSIEYKSVYGISESFNTGKKVYRSAIGQKEPIAHPCNCKHECAYGRDKEFCFPCMKKIVDEHRAARTKTDQGA